MFAVEIVLTKRNKVNEFRVLRFAGKIFIQFKIHVVPGITLILQHKIKIFSR